MAEMSICQGLQVACCVTASANVLLNIASFCSQLTECMFSMYLSGIKHDRQQVCGDTPVPAQPMKISPQSSVSRLSRVLPVSKLPSSPNAPAVCTQSVTQTSDSDTSWLQLNAYTPGEAPVKSSTVFATLKVSTTVATVHEAYGMTQNMQQWCHCLTSCM